MNRSRTSCRGFQSRIFEYEQDQRVKKQEFLLKCFFLEWKYTYWIIIKLSSIVPINDQKEKLA